MPLTSLLRRVCGYGLDMVLPPRCLVCGVMIDGAGGHCATCWRDLTLLSPPWCRLCGYPLPESIVEAPLCGTCATSPPVFDRARAALRYDDGSKKLILRFKHSDRTDIASALGRLMAKTATTLLDDADLIAPVPLHRWRLLRRGYNQAALLAFSLRRENGPLICPDLLQRITMTRSQQGLSGSQRQRNITHRAFRIHPWHRARVEGARIILIDDVLTTGATVDACARVLKAAGADAVDVLALARVVQDQNDTISLSTDEGEEAHLAPLT